MSLSFQHLINPQFAAGLLTALQGTQSSALCASGREPFKVSLSAYAALAASLSEALRQKGDCYTEETCEQLAQFSFVVTTQSRRIKLRRLAKTNSLQILPSKSQPKNHDLRCEHRQGSSMNSASLRPCLPSSLRSFQPTRPLPRLIFKSFKSAKEFFDEIQFAFFPHRCRSDSAGYPACGSQLGYPSEEPVATRK